MMVVFILYFQHIQSVAGFLLGFILRISNQDVLVSPVAVDLGWHEGNLVFFLQPLVGPYTLLQLTELDDDV